MPRKPKKQPAPAENNTKSYDEFADDGEGGDEDLSTADVEPASNSKLRDWRDVEKLKEERSLRRLIKDDFDFD